MPLAKLRRTDGPSECLGRTPPHTGRIEQQESEATMPIVYIPAAMRALTGGESKVSVGGETLREVLDRLDEAHPGLKSRLVDGDRLVAGLAVFVDGSVPAGGLRARVGADAEIYF